jgi:hypothetical protein
MTIAERKRILHNRCDAPKRLRRMTGLTPIAVILGLCPEDLPRVHSARGAGSAKTSPSPLLENLKFRRLALA